LVKTLAEMLAKYEVIKISFWLIYNDR
jgi:hypothetical protein